MKPLSSEELISFEGVSVFYQPQSGARKWDAAQAGLTETGAGQKGTAALRDLSFNLRAGEIVAVIGSSGAGKSTLIRAASGYCPHYTGTITCLGQSLAGISRKGLQALRGNIGFVFQDYSLLQRASALENVLMGRAYELSFWRALSGLYKKAAVEDAYLQLERVGMQDFALKTARRLSGGQRQRVAIARVLHQQVRLILADEPVASLDEENAQRIIELLVSKVREGGAALLINLHDVDLALRYCDRIMALKDGVCVLDKPSSELSREDLVLCYH